MVWHDGRYGGANVYGQRVRPDGTLAGDEIAMGEFYAWKADVAYSPDAHAYLVAWLDDRNGDLDLLGQRVTA